jgi:hypothetical protein
MKHFLSRFGLTIALLVGLAPLASAQIAVIQTTLSAQVNPGDQQLTVASATGILGNITNATTSGSVLFVDGEEMLVIAAPVGTLVRVQRGYDGTFNGQHASGAAVFASQLGSFAGGVNLGGPFVRVDPVLGGCVLTAETYTLRINTRTSTIWSCVNSQWMSLNDPLARTFKNFPGAGAVVASLAGVLGAPVAGLFHISGALAITGITVPIGCSTGCQITIIPDGAFTTTTATNIALASTAVVSKALIMTWEPVAAKWFPSY